MGADGNQGGGTYLRPRNSVATVGVHDRATAKALEGADRRIDRLSVHYSKIGLENL